MIRNLMFRPCVVVCWCLAAFLLAACTLRIPTAPGSDAPATPQSQASATPPLAATQTTVTPSSTPAAVLPAETAEITATNPITPTRTVGPSPTPQTTPMSTSVVTLPTPAGPPSALIEEGVRLQAEGEYAAAAELFQQVLVEAQIDDHRRTAGYHLAECYVLLDDPLRAISAWEAFLTQYPDDPRRPAATFLLAESYAQVNDCPGAVEAYSAYLAQETILGDLAHEGIGDCMAASEQIPAALIAYESALEYAPDPSIEVGLREKIAGLHLAQQQVPQALAQYDAILETARIPGYRARILYLAGQAHLSDGDSQSAFGRFREAVDTHPKEEFGYLSLIQLLDSDQPVDDLQRGMVDYYAGDLYPQAYEAALDAFQRVLQEPPSERVEEARYYMALTYRGLGQAEEEARAWEAFIARHTSSARAPQAYIELARADQALERPDRALETLRTLIDLFPQDDRALEALWRIATSEEQGGDLEAAAGTYRDIQQRFPGSDRAAAALFRAGLADYRRQRFDSAMQIWSDLLEGYPQAGLEPQTLFWLARAADAQRDSAEADAYISRLVDGWPGDFYALHAAELRAGGPITVTRINTAPVPAQAKMDNWEAVESWLSGWTELPSDPRLDTLSETLQADANLPRASRLLDVLRPLEARYWFNKIRTTWKDDPLALAQLAVYLQQTDLYAEAARATYRLWGLSPTDSLEDLPRSLQTTLYPLAFLQPLNEAAQANDLDPLLLAALVRQESYFDPIATSIAGARGLTQVMPATGEGIARSLSWPDFGLDDLYRPGVSLTFGAWYLRVQLNRFGGDPWLALAAYNGGPGNGLRWQELSRGDREIFVEVITASQSRAYLQLVYEQWAVYNRLYRLQNP
jgi:soluble lytic murein transglycosylase